MSSGTGEKDCTPEVPLQHGQSEPWSPSGISVLFQHVSCWLQGVYITETQNMQHGFSVSQSASSVAQSCPTLCDPMNHSSQASLSITNSWSLLKPMSIEAVMPSNHLILCHSLLLLPPVPPSIRVFSNESTLRMRWPKYWSFSFSISPSTVALVYSLSPLVMFLTHRF